MSRLKVLNRRRRIIELRCLGLTIPQIVKKLEGGGMTTVSEKTVFRDLHSSTVEDFVEELKRKQLADITLSKDYTVRLKYRDLMLDKLMPRKIEQKTEGKLDVAVDNGKEISNLLEQYDVLFKPVEEDTPRKNDSAEQVDQASANTQTS